VEGARVTAADATSWSRDALSHPSWRLSSQSLRGYETIRSPNVKKPQHPLRRKRVYCQF
jgi:hypothetical protein